MDARFRTLYKSGDIVGTWKIVRRSVEKYRPNARYEYLYDAVCVICGQKKRYRVNHFRRYASHQGCPAMRSYLREVALKNVAPGRFKQFMNEKYGILTVPTGEKE